MKENDTNFINEVTDYYYSTIDDDHPSGNMSAVAEKYGITRAKVNKILITSGAIDSPLHQDVIRLKGEGYDVEDIASALGVSAATVKINMPYEKVIYNGEEKSPNAEWQESYRKREKVFMDKVVRKPSELEIRREQYLASGEYMLAKSIMEDFESDSGWEEDIIHLYPKFTAEEGALFKISPSVGLLHIELNDLVAKEDREMCSIKYGHTITRDILVPSDMPLHNLHYVINQAFGFTNSHLHEYELSDDDLKWVTDGKVENWKKLVGIVFKNPTRDDDIDFWDDDYESGSPKKWMRSKYTGPHYQRCYEEGYRYVREEVENLKVKNANLDSLSRRFELNPFAVNETLSLYNIFDFEPGGKMPIKDFYKELDRCIEEAASYPDESVNSQPWLHGFAKELYYTYDMGDNWHFIITPRPDVEYLLKEGRVTEKSVKEAIKKVCVLARPVVLAADGYPLVDDCCGLDGYVEMLKAIEAGDRGMKSWATSMEWKKTIDLNVL